MNHLHKLVVSAVIGIITAFLVQSCTQNSSNSNSNMAPKATQKPFELTNHGVSRTDYFYWLNDRNNPEVIDYLNKENDYTKAALASTSQLQEDLFKEITGRIKQTDITVPYFSNGYFYYSRFLEGDEYPVICRKHESLENTEEVLLELNHIAGGKEYFQLGSYSVSPNNQLIAYSTDTVSRRKYNIYIKDLNSGELIATPELAETDGTIIWGADNKTFFYTKKDRALREYQIVRYTLGTAEEVLVYEEKDPTFSLDLKQSKSGEYIIITSYSTLSSECRIIPSANPLVKAQLFAAKQPKVEYYIDHGDGVFFIQTNQNALNFKVMQCAPNATQASQWKEFIPHNDSVLIENIEVFKDYIVLSERQNGLQKLQIVNYKTNEKHYLNFGEETYTAYASTNKNFDSNILRFEYSSLTTPNSTFEYNFISREKILLKQQEIVGGYNSNAYESKRLYATTADGVQVPISLVYKKDQLKNQGNPLLLYGYGSYGISEDPYFRHSILSLLNRGFVYAIAHIRGGEELGRQWYEDGKLLKKKNTFTDFITCGEYLIQQGYTTKKHLYALGGSAGGLLVGAVINMRPDLFNGAIAAVPFVDVVTTMLDESIPLTTSEYDEWGNPENEEYFNYMLSYSPYDNVTNQTYPNLLVTAGLHDSQVQYWEPAKWVAKLRTMDKNENLVLLHTNMSAGHGGASGRFEQYKEKALEYAFLLYLEGLEKP